MNPNKILTNFPEAFERAVCDDDRMPWEGMDDDIAEEDRPLPTVVPLGAYSEDA